VLGVKLRDLGVYAVTAPEWKVGSTLGGEDPQRGAKQGRAGLRKSRVNSTSTSDASGTKPNQKNLCSSVKYVVKKSSSQSLNRFRLASVGVNQ
jgi:hypothetical protein